MEMMDLLSTWLEANSVAKVLSLVCIVFGYITYKMWNAYHDLNDRVFAFVQAMGPLMAAVKEAVKDSNHHHHDFGMAMAKLDQISLRLQSLAERRP